VLGQFRRQPFEPFEKALHVRLGGALAADPANYHGHNVTLRIY
jgi:hypothetical protein